MTPLELGGDTVDVIAPAGSVDVVAPGMPFINVPAVPTDAVSVTAPNLPTVTDTVAGDTVAVHPAPTVVIHYGGGTGGSAGVVLTQPVPAALWSFPNPHGRLCGITLYVAGEVADADVVVTPSLITVTFPSPVVGAVVAT